MNRVVGEGINSMIKEIIDLKWKDIPENVVLRSKWVLIDTYLVLMYGIKHSEESISFLNKNCLSLKNNIQGIRIPWSNLSLSYSDAATLLGSSVVAFELDEGNQYAKGHPGAHIIPALLIKSSQYKVSGEKFLEALIKGYEICSKIAYASNMRDDMHPHGTWGIAGAVAAIGILNGDSDSELIKKVLLAFSLPIATSWFSAVNGLSVRNLYCGIGVQVALNIDSLSSSGFRSSEKNVKNIWSHILSNRMNDNLISKKRENSFMINNNYFKMYPACRFSHSSITALYGIECLKKINPAKISEVIVRTYSLSGRLRDPNPKTYLASRFSIPFLFAVILNKYSLFEIDCPNVFYDPHIRQLSRKIKVVSDKELDSFLPNKRPSSVEIIMKDGKKYKNIVEDAPSGYTEGNGQYLLRNKYYNMFSRRNISKVDCIINQLLKIENYDDVNEIFNKY